MRSVVIVVFVVVMLAGFAGSGYASYAGWGLAGDPDISVRSGSSNGIFFLGGGPGSGK